MRLIQITDCHLQDSSDALARGFDVYGSLKVLLNDCQQREAEAAGYIFTGDISNTGKPASYRLLDQLLAPLNAPVYALPGNHDKLSNMQTQLSHAQCSRQIDLGGWQLFLLRSGHAGQAEGRISDGELIWLQKQLLTEPDKPALVAVHHQPIPVGTAWIDALGLQNGAQLLELLQDHPRVKGLIFGHVHQAFDTCFQQVRILGCPSSCFQFKAGADEFALDNELTPGYRWLELHDDGSLDTGIVRLK